MRMASAPKYAVTTIAGRYAHVHALIFLIVLFIVLSFV